MAKTRRKLDTFQQAGAVERGLILVSRGIATAVGASSRDIRLKGQVMVQKSALQSEPARFKVAIETCTPVF
jgi:hypothetical protein